MSSFVSLLPQQMLIFLAADLGAKLEQVTRRIAKCALNEKGVCGGGRAGQIKGKDLQKGKTY